MRVGAFDQEPQHDRHLAEQGGEADEGRIGYAEGDSYMFEQICHRRPIVDGVTSREMGVTLLNRLSVTDLSRQREQLVQAHVKYILLHRPRNGLYLWNKEIASAAQFRHTYRTVYDGPDLTALRVY